MHVHCKKSTQEPNRSSQKALNISAEEPDTNQQKSHMYWVCTSNAYTIYTPNKCWQKALIVSAEEPDISTKEPYVHMALLGV